MLFNAPHKWIVAAENNELFAISRMFCISYLIGMQHLFYSEQIDLINYDRKFNWSCSIVTAHCDYRDFQTDGAPDKSTSV